MDDNENISVDLDSTLEKQHAVQLPQEIFGTFNKTNCRLNEVIMSFEALDGYQSRRVNEALQVLEHVYRDSRPEIEEIWVEHGAAYKMTLRSGENLHRVLPDVDNLFFGTFAIFMETV